MKSAFSTLFQQVAANMTAVAESPYVDAIERTVDLLHTAFETGHTLLVFGNGAD